MLHDPLSEDAVVQNNKSFVVRSTALDWRGRCAAAARLGGTMTIDFSVLLTEVLVHHWLHTQ